jgi:hypothetical protein
MAADSPDGAGLPDAARRLSGRCVQCHLAFVP